jgi:hypothetical protein
LGGAVTWDETEGIDALKKMMVRWFFLMIVYGHFGVSGARTVNIDRLQLVGDPHSLLTMGKMYVGHHELSLSRWYSPKRIEEVLRDLSMQVPQDTLAWSDGLVMQMLWTSDQYSHHLALTPEGEQRAAFFLSSIRLTSSTTIQKGSSQNPSEIMQSSFESYERIKTIFSTSNFSAELMFDVRDLVDGAETATLLYASVHSIHFLAQAIQNALSLKNWSVLKSSQHIVSSTQPRTVQARYLAALVKIELIEHLGKTFIYAHLSGGNRQ